MRICDRHGHIPRFFDGLPLRYKIELRGIPPCASGFRSLHRPQMTIRRGFAVSFLVCVTVFTRPPTHNTLIRRVRFTDAAFAVYVDVGETSVMNRLCSAGTSVAQPFGYGKSAMRFTREAIVFAMADIRRAWNHCRRNQYGGLHAR